MRARELIRFGDVRIWQEDESPYQRIADALKDRGVVSGRVGIDSTARFFVFDGIRKLAPGLDYVSARAVLKAAGAGGK
jgi:Xaa-Pro dipeptidase